MSGYPLFLKLAGKRVVVVGGGAVARDKGLALADARAKVLVVAPSVHPDLVARADEVRCRGFLAGDLDGAWLALAAATPAVNRAVREAADARRLFTVAVDDPEQCTAYGAARLERARITLAISSDGTAPALVALLRRALEAVLPEDLEAWCAAADRERQAWRARGVPMPERRPLLLRALNALYAGGAS